MSGQGAESPARQVSVSRCDSAPLVWRTQDVEAARSLGLVGALLGSLPRTPRQNLRLGRPLLLLPEEERLLGTSRSTLPPLTSAPREEARDAQVALFRDSMQRSYECQRVLALQERKRAVLGSFSAEGNGDSEAELRRRLEAVERHFDFPRSALAVQLSTARAGPDPRGPDAPVPPGDDARFRVFADLRRRGFYLTSAGKFGGDFLVYPGDPLRFHAHFIAVCLRADQDVALSDLLAISRLGSNVKKTVLLCSPRDDGGGGGVMYSSLTWSGMV
ncbi:tRNA-splicing endonuclease subunit Sen34 isoform X2 [Stigmatopora nigra]